MKLPFSFYVLHVNTVSIVIQAEITSSNFFLFLLGPFTQEKKGIVIESICIFFPHQNVYLQFWKNMYLIPKQNGETSCITHINKIGYVCNYFYHDI